MLVNGSGHLPEYLVVVVLYRRESVSDAACRSHHVLKHPGVRLDDAAVLRLLLRLYYFRSGRENRHVRAFYDFCFQNTCRQQDSYIYRPYGMASRKDHLTCNYVLSYRSDVLPRRS